MKLLRAKLSLWCGNWCPGSEECGYLRHQTSIIRPSVEPLPALRQALVWCNKFLTRHTQNHAMRLKFNGCNVYIKINLPFLVRYKCFRSIDVIFNVLLQLRNRRNNRIKCQRKRPEKTYNTHSYVQNKDTRTQALEKELTQQSYMYNKYIKICP